MSLIVHEDLYIRPVPRVMGTKEGYRPQQCLIDLPHHTVPVSLTPVSLFLGEFPPGFVCVTSVYCKSLFVNRTFPVTRVAIIGKISDNGCSPAT
jgi:hypothetical protein